MQSILVLGSGMVAPLCIEYLSRNSKNTITASESFSTAWDISKYNRDSLSNLAGSSKACGWFPSQPCHHPQCDF
jgi:saccharopine dehydrogenase-like NADP-dependent oxidoreductase